MQTLSFILVQRVMICSDIYYTMGKNGVLIMILLLHPQTLVHHTFHCQQILMRSRMIGVLGHDSALLGYTGPETTWANEMIFVMNHAPGAGSISNKESFVNQNQIWKFHIPPRKCSSIMDFASHHFNIISQFSFKKFTF